MTPRSRRRFAIVGAGPAGTTTALYLIRQGIDPQEIFLVDRHLFPRDKLCGGIVTAYGLYLLRDLQVDPPGDELPLYRIQTPFGSLSLRETEPSRVFSRRILDDELLRKAIASGIRVELELPVVSVEVGTQGVLLRTKRGTAISADYAILADGALGISRMYFPSPPLRRLLEGVYSHSDPYVFSGQIFFDLTLVDQGLPLYLWIIPLSQGSYFRLGVMEGTGAIPGGVLRRILGWFAQTRGFALLDLPRGWGIRPYSPTSPWRAGKILRVGEALGVDPLLGEGIAVSIGMARFLASKIRAYLDGRRLPSFRLTELGWNLWFRAVLAQWFYGGRSSQLFRILKTPALKELGASGTLTYNTLARGAPKMFLGLIQSLKGWSRT